MDIITEYISVSSISLAKLDEQVNAKIGEGYQPFGSPYLKQNPDPTIQRAIEHESYFIQAMVKY